MLLKFRGLAPLLWRGGVNFCSYGYHRCVILIPKIGTHLYHISLLNIIDPIDRSGIRIKHKSLTMLTMDSAFKVLGSGSSPLDNLSRFREAGVRFHSYGHHRCVTCRLSVTSASRQYFHSGLHRHTIFHHYKQYWIDFYNNIMNAKESKNSSSLFLEVCI